MLVELLSESNEEGIDESAIVHRFAELTKLIADSLEALAVDGDRGVPLAGCAKLGMKGIDPSIAVVLKKLSEGSP